MQADALQAAREEWARSIVEGTPDGDAAIKRYATQGAGWSWLRTLAARAIGRRAWCGFFAAWCYSLAWLRTRHLSRAMPSTYRLDRWCREDERRRVALDDLQPGDILVVGHRKRYGSHITIIERVTDPGESWQTIEGNARGRLPSGHASDPRDGVIRRARYRREASYGVRPLPGDYDAP